ncbi:hypothetical protein [Ascidiimonas aurantiaca]|uniref:hypothetical protein n=1 Tax=Ascidiimonas aurantiaca TaxID=1685432 RepID=UPI0030EF8E88
MKVPKNTQKKLTENSIKYLPIALALGLSITALVISLNKNRETSEELPPPTPEEVLEARLDSVRMHITTLINEEKIYKQVAFHPEALEAETANAMLIFKTNARVLLDRVYTLASPEELLNLEPDVLIHIARNREMLNEKEEAAQLFEHVLANTEAAEIKVHALNSLKRIYMERSSPVFNPGKAREYTVAHLQLAKADQSKNRYIHLARLYERWALNEYTLGKTASFGNKVLDSAFYCVNKLPDYRREKDSLKKRYANIYNFHNQILTASNITGVYKFYINNVGMGEGHLTLDGEKIIVRIDYLENERLVGQITGAGLFIDDRFLKFEVELKSYSDVFKAFRDSKGTLELKTENNFILNGFLYEFGKDPVGMKLVKKEEPAL